LTLGKGWKPLSGAGSSPALLKEELAAPTMHGWLHFGCDLLKSIYTESGIK